MKILLLSSEGVGYDEVAQQMAVIIRPRKPLLATPPIDKTAPFGATHRKFVLMEGTTCGMPTYEERP